MLLTKYEIIIKTIPVTNNISLFSNNISNNAKITLIMTNENPIYFEICFINSLNLELDAYKKPIYQVNSNYRPNYPSIFNIPFHFIYVYLEFLSIFKITVNKIETTMTSNPIIYK